MQVHVHARTHARTHASQQLKLSKLKILKDVLGMKKDLNKRLQHKLSKLSLDQYNALCHWGYVPKGPRSFKLQGAIVLCKSGQDLTEAGQQMRPQSESIGMGQINR